MQVHHRVMMRMHFFWGHETEILFSGWPGSSSGMYALALIFVFVLAVIVECLTTYKVKKVGANKVAVGFFQTATYTVRSGLSYMVMLAVMSFNGGVFLAAVGGHAVGFVLFGSRVSKEGASGGSDAKG
ncbi:Ctr domain-containing protein [Cephalotus follicularis]|uniref:Copper transport protein n=1 Tax=Cephalotus follicularis TaxID=3775 RepID=A0A1Q3BBP3_CEPFO|nr:Ctr domain-containing protein [Cephalotus follicularis]